MANKPSPAQIAEDAARRAAEIHKEWMEFLGMVDFSSLLELAGATTDQTKRLETLRDSPASRRVTSPDEFVRLVTNVVAQTHAVRGAVRTQPTSDEKLPAQEDRENVLLAPNGTGSKHPIPSLLAGQSDDWDGPDVYEP